MLLGMVDVAVGRHHVGARCYHVGLSESVHRRPCRRIPPYVARHVAAVVGVGILALGVEDIEPMGCGAHGDDCREAARCKHVAPTAGGCPSAVGLVVTQGVGAAAVGFRPTLPSHRQGHRHQLVERSAALYHELPDILGAEARPVAIGHQLERVLAQHEFPGEYGVERHLGSLEGHRVGGCRAGLAVVVEGQSHRPVGHDAIEGRIV